MPTETVTVAFVNEPQKNPKFGSIKTEAGEYVSVPAASLALFKKGGTYEIQYGYDKTGKYKNFERMVGSSPMNGAATAPGGGSKSVEIFVCGAINNVLHGAGTMPDVETLTQWVRDTRAAWRDGFASEDEIPF